jgi:hypothetical protein
MLELPEPKRQIEKAIQCKKPDFKGLVPFDPVK